MKWDFLHPISDKSFGCIEKIAYSMENTTNVLI